VVKITIELIKSAPTIGGGIWACELITEIPIIVKIYVISLAEKFTVLKRRIAKIANKPNAIPI
jgi:hypothetical protein